MIDFELSPVADMIVDELIDLESGEEVVILTDVDRLSIARTLATIARAEGGNTIVSLLPRIETYGNEPPETAAASMLEADVVIAALNTSISHTRARRKAAEAGTRTFVLRGVTEEMMLEGGVNTDYDSLREVTAAVKGLLDGASTVRVISPGGTDVRMDVSGRSAFALDGYFHDDALENNASVPTGEVPIAPVEGSAEGTIMVDFSMDELGLLEEPIELTIEGGRVTEVDGGQQAARLRSLLESHDANARNLAEFAIGTNPDARLIGVLAEDKKAEGTVHFAVGDNVSLGGSIESDLHLDGLVTEPSVEIDGEIIVDAGTLLHDSG